jgi:hypothetical protein
MSNPNKEARKLTAVTVRCGDKKRTEFIHARIVNGQAVISQERLNVILSKMGVQRGQTYTVD